MSKFDHARWVKNAERRASSRLEVDRRKWCTIQRQLNDDLSAIDALQELTNWCTLRGINVDFSREAGNFYYNDEGTIQINVNMRPPTQLNTLLHECGHVLIMSRKRSRHDRFGAGYGYCGSPIGRLAFHKCNIVDTEMEAWHRGMSLARRLRLSIDVSLFEHDMSKSMRSYFKWATR